MSTSDMTTLLLDEAGVEQALSRLATEIMEDGAIEDLMLVGIHRRGVELAARFRAAPDRPFSVADEVAGRFGPLTPAGDETVPGRRP